MWYKLSGTKNIYQKFWFKEKLSKPTTEKTVMTAYTDYTLQLNYYTLGIYIYSLNICLSNIIHYTSIHYYMRLENIYINVSFNKGVSEIK